MQQDQPDERTSYSFGNGEADISLAELYKVMSELQEYKEGMVIVGGWAPYFILKQFQDKDSDFQHRGSIDIDIALDPTVLNAMGAKLDNVLPALSYERCEVPEYSYSKTIHVREREQVMRIDFLAPYPEVSDRHRNLHLPVDFLARKTRGADLALSHRMALDSSGILTSVSGKATGFYVADIVSMMAMKGYVIGSRRPFKEKDAYDIYSMVMYYKNGVRSVAEEILPFKDEPLMQESMRNLAETFASENAVGPIGVATSDHLVGEAREQRQQEAFLQMQRLLELLSNRQSNG